ncbi:BspA family leucine-rich repeat surface protein [Agathobaculum butyriciproducens]|nr:BspA family leucine-rich repeat surface protein [Agathobaculum butyriciproducens]
MQRTIRQLIQSLMITVLAVIALVCSAYAANIDATVPASLPITVSSNSTVTTATNAVIHNYGSSPIIVSSINVTAENGWSLTTKDAAASASIGAKVISMGFNGSWMDASGAVDTSSFNRISSSGTLNLSYDAKTPGVVTAESSSTAATATFVVGLPPAPTMVASSSWYKSAQDRNTITKITFMDSYTPASCDEKWAADVNGTGDITCYRTGTEIIIAGNGTGKIQTNADSSSMFSSFSKLATIENLNLLNTSHARKMDGMFKGCRVLTNLDVSGFDASNVTDLSRMFFSCSKLASLDLSNWKTPNVTDLSYMFYYCDGLTNLDISNWKTPNATNMSHMLYNCKGLTKLDASSFDTSNAADTSYMFYSCSGLTSLDLSNWKTPNVTNMNHMFGACSGLTSLDISSFDTSNVTDLSRMFLGCSGLTELGFIQLEDS